MVQVLVIERVLIVHIEMLSNDECILDLAHAS
jgi:hypothetical protein